MTRVLSSSTFFSGRGSVTRLLRKAKSRQKVGSHWGGFQLMLKATLGHRRTSTGIYSASWTASIRTKWGLRVTLRERSSVLERKPANPFWECCLLFCWQQSVIAFSDEPQSSASKLGGRANPFRRQISSRRASRKSCATISEIMDSKEISGCQPNFSMALAGFPRRVSTSVGRK